MFRTTCQKGSVVAGLAIAGLLLTACAGGGGGQGGSSDSTTPPTNEASVSTDFSYDFAPARERCKAIPDNPEYENTVPGPTTTTDGFAFSKSGNVDEVLEATISGIVTDSTSSYEGLAYWVMVDLRRVLNNTKPLNVYDLKAQAQLFRKDPALATQSCLKLVDELEQGAKTAKLVRLSEPRALGYWVFKPGYLTGVWVCDRNVPVDKVTLLEWSRTFSEEKDDPIAGDTVITDPLRRALVTLTCPADAVEGDIVGDNDAPAASPSASPSASASQPAGTNTDSNQNQNNPSGGNTGGAGGPNPGDDCNPVCNPDGTHPTSGPGGGGGSSPSPSGSGGGGCTGCGGGSTPTPTPTPTPTKTTTPKPSPTPTPTRTPTPTPTPTRTPTPTPTPTPSDSCTGYPVPQDCKGSPPPGGNL